MLSIAKPLLGWFYENRRRLPFREDPTPYHIWVSEIMLQQTRMTAALPYYERFIRALPTPADLAACDTDRLHKLWEGLGYYSRADNLKRAARVITDEYGGELPGDYQALLRLPGIGPYTAGAIASIGFGIPVTAVDGNVLRVFSRLYNDRADITAGVTKARITARVEEELPPDVPGDFNQALMELGALVCLPGEAKCPLCPLASVCGAYAAGTVASLPAKLPKKPRRRQAVTVLIVRSPRGFLLERRPNKGLLRGLWQPLTKEEALDAYGAESALQALLPDARITEALPLARHVFSHVEWEICGFLAESSQTDDIPGCVWAPDPTLYAIPSAFSAYKKHLTK